MEENKILDQKEENKVFESTIDSETSLNDSNKSVVNELISTQNQEEFKDLVNLFNLNQSKKNAFRVIKLNELLDKIEDQVIERIDKNPDQMSNKELLDYLMAIESSIDRSQKYVDKIEEKPMLQLNQQNTTINIGNNETELNRESKEKVLEVIKAILNSQNENEESLIIDVNEVKGENND